MASFYEHILSCRPDEILPFISKMCNSGEVSAYLFRRLSVGSVFLFVNNNTKALTVIVFGYDSCMRNKPLEKEYIGITTVETMKLIGTSESTKDFFSSITGIAAIQIAAIQDNKCVTECKSFEISGNVSKLNLLSDINGETVSEKTDALIHLFHAVQTNQSTPFFNNL